MHNSLRSLTTSVCLLLAFSVAPDAAGQTNLSSQSGSTAGAAPIFSSGNFEGDARSGNLYSYSHPVSWQPWNTYRQMLQQISSQDMSSAASAMPPPVQPNGPAGFMTGYSNLSGAGAAAQAIPSVTGALLNGSSSSASTASVSSYAGQSTGSSMNSGMAATGTSGSYSTSSSTVVPGLVDGGSQSYQPPMPEYVPGMSSQP